MQSVLAVDDPTKVTIATSESLATLRALGFGAAPVLASVLAESLALALLGGTLGGLAAYLLFDGFTASTISGDLTSDVAFQFRVTPTLLLQGIAWATAVGLLGALAPALQSVRRPVAEGLHASR